MRLIISILFCAGLLSCRQGRDRLFFEATQENDLICDTIFDDNLRSKLRSMRIYQRSEGKLVEFNGERYFRYRISTMDNDRWNLLRIDNETIFSIPAQALDNPDKFDEETFLDLRAKQGQVWELRYGGLLGNSHLRLDSIGKGGDYFISARPIFDVSDVPVLLNFRMSTSQGVQQLKVVNFGDTISCKCLEGTISN